MKKIKFTVKSEPDYYGASYIVANLIKKEHVPNSYATWRHGWAGISPLRYAEQLCHSGNKEINALVHTKQQEAFLKNRGYHRAKAVGMPFCYVWKYYSKKPREKKSLLVMPPHMTRYVDIAYEEEIYVDQIQQIKNEFPNVVVCITSECEKKKRWRSTFERAGFKVIIGADLFDKYALINMHSLFNSFDIVTSPNLGSHIVYAALCGCKISLYGSVSNIPREALAKDPHYIKNPKILDLIYSTETDAIRKELDGKFRCHPIMAINHQEWASKEAGLENMIKPKKLAKYLGWNNFTQLKNKIKNRVFKNDI